MDTNLTDINLICVPYAGGSRYSYSSFESIAPKGINIIPVELPGRGARIMEPLLFDVNAMVDDLFIQLKPHIYKPYAIHGHSMGAILGYLVVKKIAAKNAIPLPQYLIVTGCEGPSVKDNKKKIRSNLPTDKFIDELRILGGIADEVFDDISFLTFFEPILRADFKAIEDYEYLKSDALNVPICVLFGSQEEFSLKDALFWQEESNFELEVMEFPGGHFFIFKHTKQIMDIIQKKIKQGQQRFKIKELNEK